MTGIIGGTIISSLCTCVWAEPYIVMKYGIRDDWRPKLRAYFMEYLKRVVITAAVSAAAVVWAQKFPVSNFLAFIAWGLLYTAVYAAVIVLVYRQTDEYASLKNRGLSMLGKLLQKKRV